MDFLIITVNYGNTKKTIKFINSIENCEFNDKMEVVIVDNEFSKKSKSELNELKKNSFLKIELLFFKDNHFYWPAVNKVISKKILNIKNQTKWVIISNNDIEIVDKTLFKKLLKYDRKKYPIIGPKIVTPRKKNLNPFMVEPMSKYVKAYWNLYFKSYIISLFLKRISKLRKYIIWKKTYKKYASKNVYAIHGSFMIISDCFFNKKGYLDDNFKLFCEELTTAEIAKKIKCRMYYFPELKVIHNEHSSTKKINNRKLFKIAKESHKYFMARYC